MAWTATLTSVNTKDAQRPTAVVVFTDNVKHKREETFDLNGMSSATFRARVEVKRVEFETSFDFIDTVDPATFSLKPDPPIEPTPEELARRKYAIDRFRLQALLQDVSFGLLAADDKEVTEQLSLVISERKPGF